MASYLVLDGAGILTDIKPLELLQLCKELDSKFSRLIVGTGSDDTAKKRNFYSKAIAAYCLQNEAGASINDAVNSSIDGGGDHGIDSVYVDSSETIWLVQSKYIDSGKGEPDLGDVSKFKNGVEDILRHNFERFNKAFQNKVPQLNQAFDSGIAKVKVVLAHTGNSLSDERRKMMQDLENAFHTPTDRSFVTFRNIGLALFHEFVLTSKKAEYPAIEVTLSNYGFIEEPYTSYYGTMSGIELHSIVREQKDRVFDQNIRVFKGGTAVNKQIIDTLQNEPNHFFYFNNGITLLCDKLQLIGARDETRAKGTFRLHGLSIVNGAQTANCLGDYPVGDSTHQGQQDYLPKVMVTVINLESAPENFSRQVTKYRNNQNAVDDVDFAALDENQQQWSSTLEHEGIFYRYKSGKYDEKDFDVIDAARALALTVTDKSWSAFVCLAKKDAKALFNRMHTDQANDETIYKRVFKDSHSARKIWRAVQILTQTKKVLREDAVSYTTESLEAHILRESSLFLTHILHCKTKLIDGEELNLAESELSEITGKIQAYSQILLDEFTKLGLEKSPKSVFVNQTDVQSLKAQLMPRVSV
ncbi:MAG: AIPR family protein [Thiomicrospira sp.]